MTTTITDNPAEHRFEIAVDGELGGVLEYARSEGAIDLQHTIVLPSHRGQGLGDALVQGALDELRGEEGTTVVTTCSFASKWVHEHPDYQELRTR